MMADINPNLKVTKPENLFKKPLTFDLVSLLRALSKGIGHTVAGKWEELANDAVDTLSSMGLKTEAGELAFILIRRSIVKAIFELIGESARQQLASSKKNSEALIEKLVNPFLTKNFFIDDKFFNQPTSLSLIHEIKSILQQWLQEHGISHANAKSIVERLPSYFVYSLNYEWQKNAKFYKPIVDAFDTPFTKASEREQAWTAYSALLNRRIHESIFDECFSLSQIYVPLNAYFVKEIGPRDLSEDLRNEGVHQKRVVISLEEEIKKWLEEPQKGDTIRVISGGPGSGKSSFARMFAAKYSGYRNLKILYIPLHLIDPSRDLVEEVGRFVRDEGILPYNPLDSELIDSNLLIIFDGLDELTVQGKGVAETARAFVREVDRTVEKRNIQNLRLRVLISGRELVVQENESELRHSRQIITVLPYYVPNSPKHFRLPLRNGEIYEDPDKLLDQDLRQQWWNNFGNLTGNRYEGLPKELKREDLNEITSQPLLNYLLAHSFTREKLDFKKSINLNSIYADLVTAVYERGYEKNRPYTHIRHMRLKEFFRILEEIGLAAWHGDSRSTTVNEIEVHCRNSGLGALLDVFQEGAKVGVTRLLAAFFFRRYGHHPTGDPTFVFTHKSFGEYLVAKRVVRATERLVRELQRREANPDEGWDEREALIHWATICGPSAMTSYIHKFFLNEIKLKRVDELNEWQVQLNKLFLYMLRHGIPMQQINTRSFNESMFQSRNAEESLLVALNTCARITAQICDISQVGPKTFGTWLRRIQGQRTGPETCLAARCLSYLNLQGSVLDIADLYNSNLECSNLSYVQINLACLGRVNLRKARLSHSRLWSTYLVGSNLVEAVLSKAYLSNAILEDANLERANLEGAILAGANLKDAHLEGAILERANLKGANLEGAYMSGVNLKGANLEGADLPGVDLKDAILEGAILERANLKGANLEGANLLGVSFKNANLERATFAGANLKDAYLEGANLLGVTLKDASLERAILVGANLKDTDLKGANLTDAVMEGNKTIISISN